MKLKRASMAVMDGDTLEIVFDALETDEIDRCMQFILIGESL